jgi:hypothetical protein
LQIEGQDPDKDVKKLFIGRKKDGVLLGNRDERDISPNKSPFVQNMGNWTFNSPGSYTFEVYVVDVKGNQSNIISTDITVE